MNKNKKYQAGGNVSFGARQVRNALRDLQYKQKYDTTSAGLFQKQVMGQAREDLQNEIDEWKKKIEAQRKKSSGFMKSLGILDFIPGGKWVKAGIKGIAAADAAKDMKSLLRKGAGAFGEWENSFLGKTAKEQEEKFLSQSKQIDSPFAALTQSIIGSAISGDGETFKEAFAGGGTPWKDQFRKQLNLGEDGFKDLFNFKGKDALDVLGQWGLVPGEEGFLNSPFLKGTNAGTPMISTEDAEWDNMLNLILDKGEDTTSDFNNLKNSTSGGFV